MKNQIIITSPSLDTQKNVSGVSAVVNFIIDNNDKYKYLHFCIGKKDHETGGLVASIWRTYLSFVKWIIILREHKDAYIHYNYPLDAKSIVRDFCFMWYAKQFHKKILIHVHGGLYLSKREMPWIIKWILKKVFRWNYPIIVLSEEEKNTIQKLFKANKVIVLPNCVSLNDAKNHSKRFDEKECLNLLYIGRIEKNKGIDYLIEACVMLQHKNIPFLLHIAGKEQIPNSYLPAMKERLGDCFIYEGVVSGKEKANLFKKCDIFLLPSFYEGLPMALIESMSFGLIPICTNVGSIGSVVKDGQNGIIVPVKEYNEIVSGIELLNGNRALANQLSHKAQIMILNNFSPVMYIAKLNELYCM